MAAVEPKPRQLSQLERFLNVWDARLRLVHSVRWLPRGLAAGLVAALLLAIASRIWPLMRSDIVMLLAGTLALLGIVAALLGVWVWKRTPLQLARRFDQTFGLKERLSTAVELSTGRLPAESDILAQRQIEQALRVASRVRASEGIPIHANWREWIAPLALIAAVVVALILPNPQDQVIDERVAIQQAIDEQLEELEDLREEVLNNETLSPEEQAAIVEALDETIETLEQREVTQEEAVAALQAAEQELRDLSEQAAAEQQQALAEASQAFEGTPAEELAEAMQQGDLSAAAEALQNLDLDSMTPDEQQALAEALQDAAEALEGMNPEAAEALEQAAESLQQGDTAGAEQALEQAGEAMEQQASEPGEEGESQAGQGGATSEQLEEYADKIRKGEEDVAGAGQDGGTQPGQGGMGQTQPQGSGQGQSQDDQQGQGASGSGRGEDEGPVQGGQAGDPMDTDNGPGDGGETAFEDIYDPQRIGGEGGPEVDVPGDPGAGVPTGQEGDFAENPDGQSTVPYNEVYSDYEGAANEALDSGYVPLGLRGLIQQYFTRLDPTEGGD